MSRKFFNIFTLVVSAIALLVFLKTAPAVEAVCYRQIAPGRDDDFPIECAIPDAETLYCDTAESCMETIERRMQQAAEEDEQDQEDSDSSGRGFANEDPTLSGGSGQGLGGLGVASDNFDIWNYSIIGPDSRIVDFTLAGIINAFLPFLLIIAGLLLLAMLIAGGFKIMTAVQNPDQATVGKQQITMAVVGFVILFASYWIVQILEIVFGFTILGI